jgi:predicted nucleic acid-binding protein
MGLLTEVGEGPVTLDTAAFIYLIEEHETYLPAVEPLFAALDGGALQAVVSELVLLELMVVPLRRGDQALARRYEELLTRGRGVRLVGVSRGVLRDAAALRAAMGIRTPDAIHIATALRHRCTALVTSDRALPAAPGLKTLNIAAFVPTGPAPGAAR